MIPKAVSSIPVRARRSGFTLIELLTVIAIIGVLAAILIPVVGKVRTSAKRSQGISNMRQIVLASLTYAQENRGNWFPDATTSDGFYADILTRYVGKLNNQQTTRSELFSDPILPKVDDPSHALQFAAIGIYFKDRISWQTSLLKYNNFNNIKSPARVVLFADNWSNKDKTDQYQEQQPYIMSVGYYSIWSYPPGVSTTDGNRIPPANFGLATGEIDLQRDLGQAKLGFFDGHVALVKRQDMKFSLFDPRYQ
jgi:prepilin-type N-terminal cleavage/methylation domain-containing protein